MNVAKEAEEICRQWDLHDCFRTPKAELDLFEGGEPMDVKLARILMNIAQIGLYEVIEHDLAHDTSERVGPLFASCEDAYRFIDERKNSLGIKLEITKCPQFIYGVQQVSVLLPGGR